MSIKVTGLDQFRKQLENVKNKVQLLSGHQSVPLNELLTADFLATYSTFSSAGELFEEAASRLNHKKTLQQSLTKLGTILSVPIQAISIGERCCMPQVLLGPRGSWRSSRSDTRQDF
jgi:hypothetical protein